MDQEAGVMSLWETAKRELKQAREVDEVEVVLKEREKDRRKKRNNGPVKLSEEQAEKLLAESDAEFEGWVDTHYEKASRALEELRANLDEITNLPDLKMAIRVLEQIAQDTSLEEDAIYIRLRAERRGKRLMSLLSAPRLNLADLLASPSKPEQPIIRRR